MCVAELIHGNTVISQKAAEELLTPLRENARVGVGFSTKVVFGF